MKFRNILGTAALSTLVLAGSSAHGGDGGISVEAGSTMLFGSFTYQDATVDISQELFNPRASIELMLPKTPLSVGVAYATAKNGYTLEYDNGEKVLNGSLDIKRTDLTPFLRLGSADGVNLRIGYRMFNYKLSNGAFDETKNGVLTRKISDGTAEGDLSKGVDAELNLMFGGRFKAGIMLGGSYFMDAKYDWMYKDDLNGGSIETGTATLDAVSLRLAPQISFAIVEDLRLELNYCVSATSWIGNKDDVEEDYAGYDIVTAMTVALRYTGNF